MKLYALHDKKAQALTAIHAETSDAVATRNFADAVMQPNAVLAKYPEDFELVSLCSVSQEYQDISDIQVFSDFEFRVVVTAQQIVDLNVKKPDGQLSLLKEA